MSSDEGYQAAEAQRGNRIRFAVWAVLVLVTLAAAWAAPNTKSLVMTAAVAALVTGFSAVLLSGRSLATSVAYAVGMVVLPFLVAFDREAIGLLFPLFGLAPVFMARSPAAWMLWIAWSAGFFVAYLSGGVGGAGRFFAWLQEMGLSLAQADMVVLIVRKSIHVTAYGAFAVCAFGGLKDCLWGPRSRLVLAVGWPLAFAVFDEIKQSRASGRTGSAYDVLIDLAGIALFLGFAYWRERRSIAAD